MKILIISDLFYPTNAIGALRPTKIAKGLKEKNFEVDVFTRYKVESCPYCDLLIGFEEIPNILVGNTEKRAKGINVSNLKFKIKRIYRAILSLRKSKKMLKAFKIWTKNKKNNEYDVVFSTFGPMSSLWCGLYYKKKNPKVKWICDFRDPIVDEITPLGFKKYFTNIEKKACKKADAVVAVSQGYIKRICKNSYLDKAYMIPNGYDEDDFKPVIKTTNIFTLIYAGQLYEGKRNLTPIFDAIRELILEKKISEEKIKIICAGEKETVIQQAGDMISITECVGVVPRKECLNLQFNSDILLLATWNNKGEEGVFPGKFLEYMLIRKPIIALIEGNLEGSEVAKVMHEGNFGIVYEAINKKEDFNRLKEYILKQYKLVVAGKNVDYNPEQKVLDRYNYKTIITEIEKIING